MPENTPLLFCPLCGLEFTQEPIVDDVRYVDRLLEHCEAEHPATHSHRRDQAETQNRTRRRLLNDACDEQQARIARGLLAMPNSDDRTLLMANRILQGVVPGAGSQTECATPARSKSPIYDDEHEGKKWTAQEDAKGGLRKGWDEKTPRDRGGSKEEREASVRYVLSRLRNRCSPPKPE
jgi:hypothetical protein